MGTLLQQCCQTPTIYIDRLLVPTLQDKNTKFRGKAGFISLIIGLKVYTLTVLELRSLFLF